MKIKTKLAAAMFIALGMIGEANAVDSSLPIPFTVVLRR